MLRLTVALLFATTALAKAADLVPVPEIGPDQLSFAVENMDRSVKPGDDFYRYAVGKWLDRVKRPEDRVSVSAFDFMQRRLTAEMRNVISTAAEGSATARKGSALQQVGDFYKSYMDFKAIDKAGLTPLKPEFDRIDAIGSLGDLSEYLGHYLKITGEPALASIAPSTDQLDARKTVLYFISGGLVLDFENLYAEPAGSEFDKALRANLAATLVAAEYPKEKAVAVANRVADLERKLHDGKLSPVDAMDPRKTYIPGTFDALQAQIPALDLTRYLSGLGIAKPDTVINTDPLYLPALSKILGEHSLDEIKEYLKVRLINHYKTLLGTRFDAPQAELMRILYGLAKMPPREELAQGALQIDLGHPVSRLYVENFFPHETRAKATDMVARIHQVFLDRIKTRDWLTEETRKAATEKLEKLSFKIGYPDKWIDFSGVDVRPDDVVGNVMRLTAFDVQRTLEKIGKPVVHDDFGDSRHTLPIIINAAYDSQINGFEVPAAILQPAAFEATKDAPTYFCRLGAVLGHEMTHGFDSRGRLFDEVGNMRDWWTPKDATAFEAEAQKLIDQADATEALPGLKLNGALNVGENMADVGGLTFAYQALQSYLAEHPAENVKIDGFTPDQRCFISWAQFWATKVTDQGLRSQVASDTHPPNFYRSTAALKHVDAFYTAFDIKPGDKEWLPPEKRVKAW